jgi:glycosyltransferase involved in cell wall biosynthesis
MRVLSLIWTDARWHPVVMFTAQIFSEQGYAVEIVARRPNPESAIPGSFELGSNVTVHQVGGGHSGGLNRLDYLGFLFKSYRLAREAMPDVIIGYDMHGLAAALCARTAGSNARLIYHNLDLVAKDLLSAYGRSLKRVEGYGARRADLTIFSSSGRANIFRRTVQLERDPMVVMNCQRLALPRQRSGELQSILASRGLSFDRLVVRLGSLGPNHGIEATIRSVVHWKGNWGLVFAGVPVESYLEKIEDLVASLGLRHRVVVFPSVPYSFWYDCLYSADLGIALYEPGNINHAHMAGAGNRLNLYLKAGIPSVVPNFSDFVAFVDEFNAGKVAEPTDPRSIASAVNAVLSDDREFALLCRNAKLAFEREYNFERQFDKVLSWLDGQFQNPGQIPPRS